MAYERSVRSLAAAIAVSGMLAIAVAATPGSAAGVHRHGGTSSRAAARTTARVHADSGASALQRALDQVAAMPDGRPGVIGIVQHGSRNELYQAGTESLADRRALRASGHARLASIAKTYSAAVALGLVSRLVSRGKLRLSDTIGRVLPSLPRAWHRVTLRELLQHRSGLPDYSTSQALRKRLALHPRATILPRQLLRYVFDKPLQFRPGSRYKYDSSDNVVAAMMAEAVTGRSYAWLLRTLGYRPAGLNMVSRQNLIAGGNPPR
jgi:D-alanyl-D-alanine carboxypeptidase